MPAADDDDVEAVRSLVGLIGRSFQHGAPALEPGRGGGDVLGGFVGAAEREDRGEVGIGRQAGDLGGVERLALQLQRLDAARAQPGAVRGIGRDEIPLGARRARRPAARPARRAAAPRARRRAPRGRRDRAGTRCRRCRARARPRPAPDRRDARPAGSRRTAARGTGRRSRARRTRRRPGRAARGARRPSVRSVVIVELPFDLVDQLLEMQHPADVGGVLGAAGDRDEVGADLFGPGAVIDACGRRRTRRRWASRPRPRCVRWRSPRCSTSTPRWSHPIRACS